MGGEAGTVGVPQMGHLSFKVYLPHLGHFLIKLWTNYFTA